MATEQVAEQVAEGLEEAAKATRQVDARAVGFFMAGTVFGIAVGLYFGYRFNREHIKAELFKESEEEIARIRETYQAKLVALENQEKAPVEDIVKERGYTSYSTKVTEQELPERPLSAPVPIEERRAPLPIEVEEPTPVRTFRTTLSEKDKHDGWNYPKELAQRRADQPYIIHQDEFATNESGYPQVTYVYYAGDNILAGEDERVITNPVDLIGPGMFSRFGHGTDDYNMLYIRNPELQMEFELCRSPGSYEEEVLGLAAEEPHDDEDN
jgi:hypothetical protein